MCARHHWTHQHIVSVAERSAAGTRRYVQSPRRVTDRPTYRLYDGRSIIHQPTWGDRTAAVYHGNSSVSEVLVLSKRGDRSAAVYHGNSVSEVLVLSKLSASCSSTDRSSRRLWGGGGTTGQRGFSQIMGKIHRSLHCWCKRKVNLFNAWELVLHRPFMPKPAIQTKFWDHEENFQPQKRQNSLSGYVCDMWQLSYLWKRNHL